MINSALNKDDNSKPILIKKDNDHYIKIDNGDHYYQGIIKQTDFPDNIKNFIDIIEKSLIGYNDSHEIITSNLINSIEDPTSLIFCIKYDISYGNFTQNFSVNIILNHHQKEQIDYINERFNIFENNIKFLMKENNNLIEQIKIISSQLEKYKDDDLESQESSDDDQPSVKPKVIEPASVTSKRRSRVTS